MTLQETSVSHSPPQPHSNPQDQACPICEMWARMPYAKRWSTPTSVNDTESALVVGFWLALCSNSDSKLCERHYTLIVELEDKGTPLLLPSRPSEAAILKNINANQSRPQEQPFTLGPGPFTNENTITPPPPLPIPQSALQPSPGLQSAMSSPLGLIPNLRPTTANAPFAVKTPQNTPIDPVKLALDAARMPPVEGKKTTTCPLCNHESNAGEVHVCQE